MKVQRFYSTSDVGMLTAILTIIESAIEVQDFLAAKRPLWAEPYFQNIRQEILKAFQSILGIDNVKELSRYTKIVTQLQQLLIGEVSDFRVQFNADFADNPARREELQNLLGFKNAGVTLKAYRKDQESLSQLLQRIKTNLTPETKTELQEKGMSPQTIETILTNADPYIEANVKQESFKGHKKKLTEENIKELNDLYSTVIGIAKIARSFYKGDPAQQAKVAFRTVLRNQGYKTQKTEEEETEQQDVEQ